MLGNIQVKNNRHTLFRLFFACAIAALCLSACASAGGGSAPAATEPAAAAQNASTGAASPTPTPDPNATPTPTPTPEYVDLSQYPEAPQPQLDPTPDGDEIAVLHTDMGDITLRFFPDYAPKAVQNFKTHAKSGYFNNNIFTRVVANQFVQSGDPTGTGTGGQSIWGQPFQGEPNLSLHNIYGAVSMIPDQNGGQGSQFIIVANKSLDSAVKTELESFKDKQNQVAGSTSDGTKIPFAQIYPLKIIDKYLQGGGLPDLDRSITVFAQVINGFDALDKIAAVQTSSEAATKGKPLTDVKINSITFEKYKAS